MKRRLPNIIIPEGVLKQFTFSSGRGVHFRQNPLGWPFWKMLPRGVQYDPSFEGYGQKWNGPQDISPWLNGEILPPFS